MPVSEHGRWVDMDAADFDNDGDTDIVVANFSIAFMGKQDFEPTWDTQAPVLLLLNQTR